MFEFMGLLAAFLGGLFGGVALGWALTENYYSKRPDPARMGEQYYRGVGAGLAAMAAENARRGGTGVVRVRAADLVEGLPFDITRINREVQVRVRPTEERREKHGYV